MKQLLSMAAIAALVSFAAPSAQAADKSGYLTDKAGNPVQTKSGCVRTKSWTMQNADEACLRKAKASSK